MERRLLKNFDIGLVLVMVLVIIYGLATIYSASRGGALGTSLVHRQLMWAIGGAIAFALAVSFDHKSYPRILRWVYGVNILLLVAVLAVGQERNGAKSWFGFGGFGVQPSEFAKVAVIMALAVYLSRNSDHIGELPVFLKSLMWVGATLILVMGQPDLGTSMVLMSIWFGMVFVAGARAKHLAVLIGIVAVMGVVGWHGPTFIEKTFGKHVHPVFKEYQKKRLASFINPEVDPRNTGYHVIQSRIAIGSGQTTGRGYLHGTQGQLGFIPERHTDFIFTVVGEELGFVGAGLLLLLYFVLVWKGLVIMSETEDSIGRFTAAGVVAMFLFHIVENIGMTLGVMPVTGVPLPLFSYGGSNLLANMMALGLLVGIGMRRHKINF